MLPWILAGACLLANLITLSVVAAAMSAHGRARRARRAAGEGPGAVGACRQDAETPLRRDVAALARELDRLAEAINTRTERRAGELTALLEEADRRIAELRRLMDLPRPGPGIRQEADARRSEIIRLAAEGTDPLEIARRTRSDVGEVELVLSLQRPRSPRAGPP